MQCKSGGIRHGNKKGEKPPREIGKRVRVRLTISSTWGKIMSHLSFIPREGCVQKQSY
jgi:hypothetical protein